MDDVLIIEMLFCRDDSALLQLSDKYSSLYKSVIRGALSDECDVEECANDLLLAVWNAIPPQKPEHFKGWLAVITRNSALTLCRQRSKEPESVGDAALELALALTEGPEEQVDTRVMGEAISRFLEQQPRHIRAAFLRRYWYGDSVEETAKFVGWGKGKTKTVLFRTRKKLKEYLVKEELFNG